MFLVMKRKEATILKSFTARIPEPLIHRLKVKAARERKSMQTVMREAFELYLKQRPEGTSHE
jgi:hypothetical protein